MPHNSAHRASLSCALCTALPRGEPTCASPLRSPPPAKRWTSWTSSPDAACAVSLMLARCCSNATFQVARITLSRANYIKYQSSNPSRLRHGCHAVASTPTRRTGYAACETTRRANVATDAERTCELKEGSRCGRCARSVLAACCCGQCAQRADELKLLVLPIWRGSRTSPRANHSTHPQAHQLTPSAKVPLIAVVRKHCGYGLRLCGRTCPPLRKAKACASYLQGRCCVHAIRPGLELITTAQMAVHVFAMHAYAANAGGLIAAC